ncbi:MAG: DUF2971 domain-containing protein [Bdellovibrionales bacterium]|nr:DUF2971 domain-containing protein [Bdellovibrionales bacterium]
MNHKKLYKYYSFDEKGYWQAPLKDNYLYFNTYKNFNDPYEFYFKANQSADWKTKLKVLKAGNPDSDFIHRMNSEVEVEKYLSTLKLNNVWKNMEGLFSNFGICCFSKSPDIILMWSHYCKSHSGFCLEFDIEKLNACANGPDKIKWIDVEYVERVPEFSIFASPTFDNYIKYKFSSWSYEEEVRAFRLPTNYVFPVDCITGITFGLNSINHKAGTDGHRNMTTIKGLIDGKFAHLKSSLTLAKKNKDVFKIDLQKINFQFLA